MGLARIADRVNLGGVHGRGRLVFPDAVDQIIGTAQRDAAAVQGVLKLDDLPGGMQPRIKADHATFRQLCAQPFGQRDFGPGHRRIDICHLRLDLRAVAPIDKHARHIA